jgi:hypothetical protein
MRLLRYQFKIRHLLVMVALCAVLFALLRTPFAALALAFAAALPGFFIERARGGAGILGAAFSTCIIASLLAVVVMAPFVVHGASLGDVVHGFMIFIFYGLPSGFICGLLCGAVLWTIAPQLGYMFGTPVLDESCAPIRLYPPAEWGARTEGSSTREPDVPPLTGPAPRPE